MGTTTPADRIEVVTRYWLDAMGNYYRDMAATRTADEARAVEDNYNAAERLYLDAVECGLTRNDPAVEIACARLIAANGELADCRTRVAAFAVILGKLTRCTEAAGSLVAAATGEAPAAEGPPPAPR